MSETIIGICADGKTFHIPCANRVYGEFAIYLAMYPEVYEGQDFVRDCGGVPINTVPTFSVSPVQRDFSGRPITIVTDATGGSTPQICGYPLCRQPIDGSDVVPEDVWVHRHDMGMRRYLLRYASRARQMVIDDGLLVEDERVEELDFYVMHFFATFGYEPTIYIGGNNLQPLAHYESLTSLQPRRVLERRAPGEVMLDFCEDFSLPVRATTPVWETMVLTAAPQTDPIPGHFTLTPSLCLRRYEHLCATMDTIQEER
jgi:hypothetical protein